MLSYFFDKSEKAIKVTANSRDYISEIKPLYILLDSVDKHQFDDSINNLTRLVDILTPYVSLIAKYPITKQSMRLLYFYLKLSDDFTNTK